MPKMTTVFYKCVCGKDEVAFDMPARRHGEDISGFMGRMTKWLGEDHAQRSPFCRATETEYVKIAAPEDRPIGSAKEAT